jgi:anti-anti-sigma factor
MTVGHLPVMPGVLREGATVALTSSSHREAATVTITLRGDADLTGIGDFEETVASHLGTGVDTIEIDLTGVAFIDSAGINALLKGRRAAEENGQTFVVTDASGLVREMLDMTGVWAHLSGRAA